MVTCPKCGAKHAETMMFCNQCGERLTGGEGARPTEGMLGQFRDEIARVRTSVVDRITALEEARDRAAIVAQRIPVADPREADRGFPGPRGRPASELRELDRSAAGFTDFADFIRVLNANPGDTRLQTLNTRALEMTTGASGGFLVPSQWSDALVDAITYASIVRPYCRYAPRSDQTPDAEIEMPLLDYAAGRFGGVQVGWLGEGAPKAETQPTFAVLKLKPQEIAGFMELTDKLLRNTQGLPALLGGLFAQAIAATEDDAFLNGSGVARPLGILNSPACINVTRAAPAAVAYDDLVRMEAATKPGGSYRWVISQTCLPQLREMTWPVGIQRVLLDAAGGQPATLLSYPVSKWEAAPVLGSRGDMMLVDMAYYMIADGTSLTVAMTDAHGTLFTQNRSVLKAFHCTDAQPWLSAPILLPDGATMVSPFVALL